MYNYYDYSIQYKKPSNLEELTKKFFKVERDWCDSVRKLGYYIEIEASTEFLGNKVATPGDFSPNLVKSVQVW